MDSRGVGPSTLERLTHDRSIRLAAGLAVAVAIPVAILFYFQFRSISNLAQSSAVVLRQHSQETINSVADGIEDALKSPYVNVVVRITPPQTEPLDLPFIQRVFEESIK